MNGIFFIFLLLSLLSLCYPFSAHPCSLYPYILSYYDIHTRNTIRKSRHPSLSPVYQSTVASQWLPKEG
jgi:hypothetical protein